jgi:hypothetical protein
MIMFRLSSLRSNEALHPYHSQMKTMIMRLLLAGPEGDLTLDIIHAQDQVECLLTKEPLSLRATVEDDCKCKMLQRRREFSAKVKYKLQIQRALPLHNIPQSPPGPMRKNPKSSSPSLPSYMSVPVNLSISLSISRSEVWLGVGTGEGGFRFGLRPFPLLLGWEGEMEAGTFKLILDRVFEAVLAVGPVDPPLTKLLIGAAVVGGREDGGVLAKAREETNLQFTVDRSNGGGGSEESQEFMTELSLSTLKSGPSKDWAPPILSNQAVCFSAFSAS